MPLASPVLSRLAEIEVKRLRGQCVKEIKSTNGLLSFEEALRWQRDG